MSDDERTCPACRASRLDGVEELRRNLCEACSRATGLWIAVPDARPPVPCARCGHTRFVRAQLRERAAAIGDHPAEYFAPLAVTFATRDAPYGTARRQRAYPREPHGILIAYACEDCGFTELYTVEPRKIPIGPQYGTDLVDVAPPRTGPFR